MIIGSEGDYHAKHILERLQARGTDCFYLDTQTYPSALQLDLTPSRQGEPGHLITPEGKHVALSDIRSVYWRYHQGVQVAADLDSHTSTMVYREIDSALGSLWRNLPHARWVNSVTAIERHRFKTHQLALMAQAGIPVPETLVSNNPDSVRAFFEKHQGNVIYKPVAGGAHTAKLKPEDLSDARMSELKVSPVQFQEMIPGVDIRVYLIGDTLFSAEIQAGTLDFRDDPEAAIVSIDLPDDIQAHCRTIARLFEYVFTGIDVRRTPEGRYCFLEGNPSPMFVHFENKTGFPISEKLMDLLEAG